MLTRMKAFVTGATGLLGNNLVRALRAEGHEVVGLVRSDAKARRLLGDTGATWVVGDMRSPEAFAAALDGCDVVFHTAAYFREYYQPGDHAEALAAVNVRGTLALMALADDAGVRTFVHTSSSGTIGSKPDGSPGDEDTPPPPIAKENLYFRSKVDGDAQIHAFAPKRGMAIIEILPGWMWGPGDAAPTGSGQLAQDFLARKVPAIPPGGSERGRRTRRRDGNGSRRRTREARRALSDRGAGDVSCRDAVGARTSERDPRASETPPLCPRVRVRLGERGMVTRLRPAGVVDPAGGEDDEQPRPRNLGAGGAGARRSVPAVRRDGAGRGGVVSGGRRGRESRGGEARRCGARLKGRRRRATRELLSNALQGQAWVEAVKVGDVTRDHERAFSSRTARRPQIGPLEHEDERTAEGLHERTEDRQLRLGARPSWRVIVSAR